MKTLHRIIKNSLDKKKRLPEGNLSCGDPGEAGVYAYNTLCITLIL